MFNRMGWWVAVIGLVVAGCQGGGNELSEAEDKEFKKQLNSEFDINNVPPENRDRVRAIMEAQRRPAGGPSDGGASQ